MNNIKKLILGTLVSSSICLASSQTPGTLDSSVSIVSSDRVLSRTVSGLQMFDIFNGKYGLSTDGFGGYDNTPGTISAQIMPNSTIEKAYLYAAGVGSYGSVNDVEFEGTTVDFMDDDIWSGEGYNTGRKDITSLVNSAINSGACDVNGLCDFDIKELGYNDGEALVIVYKNSALPDSTIAILDGHANMSGDSTILNLTDPIDKTKPGFFAHMYLGISYSYSDESSFYQTSDIKVNDETLTQNAGSQDDGFSSNGGLITVGSFDDTFAPLNPEGWDDHEKYDLTQLLNSGEESIKVDTYNSSQDDNIFLAIFHISQKTESVYIDGGPIVNGPSDIFAKKGDTLTLSYNVQNTATAAIDISLSLSNSNSVFVNQADINSNFDVNESKTIEVNVTIPADYTLEEMNIKLSALGNDINALASTKIRFEKDDLFDGKPLVAGWNLLGAAEDMAIEDVVGSMEKEGFNTRLVFRYDSDGWKVFSPDNSYDTTVQLPILNNIEFERGFWIYLEPKQ